MFAMMETTKLLHRLNTLEFILKKFSCHRCGSTLPVMNEDEVSVAAKMGNMTEWHVPYSKAWELTSTIILVIFMVFGIVANALTIAVIQNSEKLRTKYYTFIASMCVSDLISAVISPLFLYRRLWGFEYFYWPPFFCKMYWGVDYWTSYVTALHILSFAILRFIGVQFPTTFRKISQRHTKIWLSCIWLVAFAAGLIPHVLFNEVKVIDRTSAEARWASCSLSREWFDIWKTYIAISYPLFLYIPAGCVIVLSLSITGSLLRHHKPGASLPPTKQRISNRRAQKNKQIIMQLMLIVGSFLLGYIPVTAFHWHTGYTLSESNPELNRKDWNFAMIQYILLRFSECLNPIFYNIASRKMRAATFSYIKSFAQVTESPTRTRGMQVTSTVSSL